jgi:hypothetical protein
VEKSSDMGEILVKLLIINFEGGLVRHGNVKWTVLFSCPIDRELIFFVASFQIALAIFLLFTN